MPWLDPLVLEGPHVRLEPLRREHCAALQEAVRDGELWKLWYTPIPEPEAMADEIERRLAHQAAGGWLPFVVIEPASGQVAGMTSYMNIEAEHRRLEIGATWYRKRVQRTALNTDAKRLLLGHAFEQLGAKLDGILRNHRLGPTGLLRDSCVYSILNTEWPMVKTHLEHQLGRERAGTR